MRVLIAGATGKTGRILARQLAENGHTPVAMIREGSDTGVLPEGCETRTADLTDLPGGVAADVDAVVFAAGSGGHTGEAATDAVDRDGAIGLVDACAAKGPRRFVMLSAAKTDDPENGPVSLRHYYAAKKAADAHLRASGLDYAIVRSVGLTDDPAIGRLELSDDVEGRTIAREDVAAVLMRCAVSGPAGGAQFEIASGEVPTEGALASL